MTRRERHGFLALTEQLEARLVQTHVGLALDQGRASFGVRDQTPKPEAAVQDLARGNVSRLHAFSNFTFSLRHFSARSEDQFPKQRFVGTREAMRSLAQPIALDSPFGEKLLAQSTVKQSFLPLASNFTTQRSETFCSIASTAMVLNATGIARPVSTEDPYYHYFDQRNLITDQVKATVDMADVAKRGMTLDIYGRFIGCFPVTSRVVHASETTLGKFRALATRALQSSNSYIVVNYQRQNIGQETGGHFSPIAAYNAKTDRFLIMDVSRYAYPPVWVPAARLWQGMMAVDSDSGISRGFALITAPSTPG